jgi:2,4-dienoyl-CoA reductase-like NADH-dependent reductase (Old Yellow Enzyme family)
MSRTFLDKPADAGSSLLDYEKLNTCTPASKQKNCFLGILLEPFRLNDSLILKNRCVMAPMTRCFANNGEPTESMAEYYGKRNGFGLIISEATMINKEASGYPNTPGIFLESQVSKWRLVCDKVHESGSKFFTQLWHAGMMSHSIYRNGKQPIAASDVIQNNGFIPRTNKALMYDVPKPMDKQDMEEIKRSFRESALNARKAGCDGIELHAANGYLLDSFLHYYSNRRTDAYGGNPENMSRFLLEIIDGLILEIGSERIGIRLSPLPVVGMNNMKEDIRDHEVFVYILSELKKRNIAYVHVSADDDIKDNGQLGMPVSHFLKKHFGGTVIGCGSYSIETGAEAINEKQFELLAFGRLAIANPGLVEFIKNNQQSSILSFEPKMLEQLV